MSQPSRRRLRIETNGETGRVRDDCVFQWVNKPFKGFMHEKWAKWIEAPTHHVTLAGRVKQPSISNVCEWVKNSWQ